MILGYDDWSCPKELRVLDMRLESYELTVRREIIPQFGDLEAA